MLEKGLYLRTLVGGADENPSLRKCVHPVREEGVATFKIPIRDGFLDKCKR